VHGPFTTEIFYVTIFYDIGIEVLENEDGFLAEDEDLFPLAADG